MPVSVIMPDSRGACIGLRGSSCWRDRSQRSRHDHLLSVHRLLARSPPPSVSRVHLSSQSTSIPTRPRYILPTVGMQPGKRSHPGIRRKCWLHNRPRLHTVMGRVHNRQRKVRIKRPWGFLVNINAIDNNVH